MSIHTFSEGCAVRFHSYGSSYHAFVMDTLENEIVIYDPATRTRIFHRSYPRHEFTSMIMFDSDVYVGTTKGTVLVLRKDRNRQEYIETFVKDENDKYSLDGPVAVLGTNREMTCLGAGGKNLTDWNLVILYIGEDTFPFDMKGHLECYTFDGKRSRFLCVVKSGTQRYLYRFHRSKFESVRVESFRLNSRYEDAKLWKASAVSIHGDVAIGAHGLFRIVNPTEHTGRISKYLFRGNGNTVKINQGGQASFAGDNDEFFIYCQNWSSQIAVARRLSGGWEQTEIWNLETGSKFNKRRPGLTYSNIDHPGSDGKNLIVRVGPDGFGGDEGVQVTSNVLCVFDLYGSEGLELPPNDSFLEDVLCAAGAQDLRSPEVLYGKCC